MQTIISKKHVTWETVNGEEREVVRLWIAVTSSSDLPTKRSIPGLTLHEGSRAWDISGAKNYGWTENGIWNEQVGGNAPGIVKIKGTVASVSDLPSTAEPGWLYFVGLPTDDAYSEYVYTDSNRWEFIGYNMITVDDTLSATSENPVQNKVIYAFVNAKPGLIESSGGEIFNTYSGDSKNSAYDRAHAEGLGTSASGLASHSEGVGTTASGDQSHAEGKNTTASNSVSHAEGEDTNATGPYSHAEGKNTTAEGRGTHAEGMNTKAIGMSSHAEGSGTTASNSHSHSEGAGTTASGFGSHAEGVGTVASNSQAHSEGQNSKALGVCSHVEGNGTTAQGQSQHAEGEYNTVDNSVSSDNPRGTFAHIIGNGTSDSNRSNAYAIGWDGKIYQPSDPNANPNGVFLSSKADKATTYTKAEIDTMIGDINSVLEEVL